MLALVVVVTLTGGPGRDLIAGPDPSISYAGTVAALRGASADPDDVQAERDDLPELPRGARPEERPPETPAAAPAGLSPADTGAQGSPDSIICAPAYAWSCSWALAVADCESHFQLVIGAGRYVSWFQVDGGPMDPEANTAAAYAQWLQWQRGERTISPWPGCPK